MIVHKSQLRNNNSSNRLGALHRSCELMIFFFFIALRMLFSGCCELFSCSPMVCREFRVYCMSCVIRITVALMITANKRIRHFWLAERCARIIRFQFVVILALFSSVFMVTVICV